MVFADFPRVRHEITSTSLSVKVMLVIIYLNRNDVKVRQLFCIVSCLISVELPSPYSELNKKPVDVKDNNPPTLL